MRNNPATKADDARRLGVTPRPATPEANEEHPTPNEAPTQEPPKPTSNHSARRSRS